IVVENWWWRATFDKTSAALVSLVELASGREFLRGPLRMVAMRDTGDAWGGDVNADFNTPVGEFTALTPEQVGAQWAGEEKATGSALRLLPGKEELLMGSGRPVSVTVEGLTAWQRSQASIQITLYADLPWIDVNTRLHMQERRKMIKLVIPFKLAQPRVTCEVPYGIAERAADGSEHVHNRWVRLDESPHIPPGKRRSARRATGKAIEPRSIVVANNGIYGFAAMPDGTLGLSIARSAVHTRWGDQVIEPDEHHTFIDQGQVDTRFRIVIGEPEVVTEGLWPATLELNQPLDAFAVFYPPTPQINAGRASQPFLQVSPPTVQLGTLKKAEEEEALIIRLVESAGKPTTATLTLEGVEAPQPVTLAPFEIVTLKVTRKRRGIVIKPCSLLET
ncbi:MAG: glycoside hydrolase family 38 C-terminal domain-containing protein, partial [Anaerolineae bacterium]|nr:glycosyl hydrolase-related protein [Thermoflexales bacterium]MDW8407611.1 glycoside hydrolase family 38 C-terminal domain-containing protein [Anaerolineae bacterium]